MNPDVKELFYPFEWTARFIIIALLVALIAEPIMFYFSLLGAVLSLILGVWNIGIYVQKKGSGS